MINFNVPPYVGMEEKYIHEVIMLHKICGDGQFTKSAIIGSNKDSLQKK